MRAIGVADYWNKRFSELLIEKSLEINNPDIILDFARRYKWNHPEWLN